MKNFKPHLVLFASYLALALLFSSQKSYSQTPTYCTPTITNGCMYGDMINTFEFGGINNSSSGCAVSSLGYSDYPLATWNATFQPGSSYNLFVECYISRPQGFAIFMDVNQDGDFTDLDELLWTSQTTAYTNFTDVITIPNSTAPGVTRIRVLSKYNAFPNINDVCGVYDNGECEDYTVNVLGNSDYNLAIINSSGNLYNCNFGTNEQVSVRVMNFGFLDVSDFWVYYNYNNQYSDSIFVQDTISYLDGVDIQLDTTFDFSAIGSYSLDAWVSLPQDTFPLNDTILSNYFHPYSNTSLPYFQDFENSTDWIFNSNNSSWDWGNPINTPINNAFSGQNCIWNNDSSVQWSELVSPCFDFSGISNPVISLKLNGLVNNFSFLKVMYSTDQCTTWHYLNSGNESINWYNGIQGWNNLNQPGWIACRTNMPDLGNEPSVNLKFELYNHVNQPMNVGIDDIMIGEYNLTGQVSFDNNGNCALNGIDYYLSNFTVTLDNGDVTTTDAQGAFKFFLLPDTYQIQTWLPPNYEYACSTNLSVIIQPDSVYYSGVYLNPINDFDDQILLYSWSGVDAGSTGNGTIRVWNMGSDVENTIIKMKVDTNLVSNITSIYNVSFVAPDTYKLSAIPNILPLGFLDIPITYDISNNAQPGDSLRLDLIAEPLFSDTFPSDNIFLCRDEIWLSYDPNDKLVTPAGQGYYHMIEQTDTILNYTIRFQNTGTGSALHVIIRDTLPEVLNPASLLLGPASHFYKFYVEDKNIFVFYFPFINLPDSASNEAGSKGFVSFRVNTDSILPLGSVINNEASIYFDFNPPVITPLCLLTVDIFTSDEAALLKNQGITLYPNPAGSYSTVKIKEADFLQMKIYTITNSLIDTYNLKGLYSFQFNTSTYPQGMYFVELTSRSGERKTLKLNIIH